MDEKIEDIPGILGDCNLSEGEMVLFLEYLTKIRGDTDYYILGKCFKPKDVFKFFDLYSGKSIRVWKRRDIFKVYEYIRIYSYFKVHGIDEKTICIASKKYNKRATSLRRIYKKVDSVLTSDNKDYVLKENEEDDE